MPPPSQAARRFWWWAKAHPKAAGVKPSVAKEFTESDKGGKLPERVKDGKPVKSRGEKWYGGK
jgi:hypothetical protein